MLDLLRRLLLRAPPEATAEPGEGDVAFTFLGTAGFIVASPGRTLVLDPYLTRSGPWTSLFGRLVPDEAAIAHHVPHADDVLVGHAHHDHVLDAPALCRRTGARLLGSPATMHVASAAGLDPAQRVEVHPGDRVACGDVQVRAWRSRHGKALFGRVPLPGDLTAPPPWPPRMRDLRHGQVLYWHLDLGGLRVLHVDSADFYDDELPEADVLLLCAVGRQYRQDYTRTLVERVKPQVVLPCHWDDFTVPLDAAPRQLPGVDVEGFCAEIRAAGARPVVLGPLQTWRAGRG